MCFIFLFKFFQFNKLLGFIQHYTLHRDAVSKMFLRSLIFLFARQFTKKNSLRHGMAGMALLHVSNFVFSCIKKAKFEKFYIFHAIILKLNGLVYLLSFDTSFNLRRQTPYKFFNLDLGLILLLPIDVF